MTLAGWCPGGRTVPDMLARYDARAVRIFVGVGDPLPAWDGPILGPMVGRGVVVHLSFKTNPTAEVLAWAGRKPPGLILLLTYAHEPEQQRGGDPTVRQFHTRWGELVPAFDGHPLRDEILLGPVYTRYWWQENAGDLRWLVNVPVDFIGWDVYNNGSTYRPPGDLLSIPRQIAARTGVPYLVAELGALRLAGDGDGLGRSAWMRAMVAAVDSDGGLTACWYHKDEWDLTGPGSAGEQQTWRELIREAPMAWSKGQPWRVVRSLDRLHEQIRAKYPRAVPPATDPNSWGALADGAHSMTSDHYPHYYSALGATAVVTARDFPHAPELGLDFGEVAEDLRLSRDPRIKYVIFDGRMFSSYASGGYAPFTWRPYSGPDMHRTHGHVSSVHTAAADDPRDWQIGEDDIMATIDDLRSVLREELAKERANIAQAAATETLGRKFSDYVPAADGTRPGLTVSGALFAARADSCYARAAATSAAAGVSDLSGKDFTDEQAIVAGVLAGLSPEAIAAAIPPEIADQVADRLAARLAS
ncbi:hypothetical protein [Micromonospora chersina]